MDEKKRSLKGINQPEEFEKQFLETAYEVLPEVRIVAVQDEIQPEEQTQIIDHQAPVPEDVAEDHISNVKPSEQLVSPSRIS